MKEVLERVLSEYLVEKTKEASESELWDYLSKKGCIKSFYDTGIIDMDRYTVRSSAGQQNNWAYIPWIGIFDKEIGTKATEGYYIVYLFSADMKKIYLSLNQGWSYFEKKYKIKKGKENIKNVAGVWRNKLCSGREDFRYDDIDLEYHVKPKTTDLPEGYELGHICGKCYYADNLPEEEMLVRDLQNILAVFRELKGNLINKSIDETNNHLLAEYKAGVIENLKESKAARSNGIEAVIASEANKSLLCKRDELPDVFIDIEEPTGNSSSFAARTINYTLKAEKQGKLGLAGELMVINYERQKLQGLNIKKQVEHISKISKDREGYDIKSYDENGKEMHIEVKTTQMGINTPFYLTKKELKYCVDNADKYYLYRIYNFDDTTQTGDFYIVKGRVDKLLKMEPQTYIVNGRISN